MCVNEARLTSSRSTDSAKAGGDDIDESSVVVVITGVEAYRIPNGKLIKNVRQIGVFELTNHSPYFAY